MIARIWHGRAPQERADAYVFFLETKVFPSIRDIEGHEGAYILQRTLQNSGDVEFIVLTLWQSMDAVRLFAGDDPSVAVVEDEAKALLSTFDGHVAHFKVVRATRQIAKS
ncbi:MAG: antibiotic biosynthesis monooxygenase [Candidatus Aminicenantes bacterium]|nr:antibiotic biosynthesis monooxygenase [Candidatus Aminicenantes bacterium]